MDSLPDLTELFVNESEEKAFLERALKLPSLNISKIDLQWVQVLAEGWASPLKVSVFLNSHSITMNHNFVIQGFMREEEYIQCINFGLLIKDKMHNQTIPIVLAINEDQKKKLENIPNEAIDDNASASQSVTLMYDGQVVAILEDYEMFAHRKEERAASVYKTTNPGHPSIKMIMESGEWLIGGDLKVGHRILWNDGLDQYRLTPKEIRIQLKRMNVSRSNEMCL